MATIWEEAKSRAARVRADTTARRTASRGNTDRARRPRKFIQHDHEWCALCARWQPRPHRHRTAQ